MDIDLRRLDYIFCGWNFFAADGYKMALAIIKMKVSNFWFDYDYQFL